MTTTFAERRRQVEARIEQLVAKAGIALLDGEDYSDHGELGDLQAELLVIVAAEAEAARRSRQAAEEARADQRQKLVGRLIKQNADRLRAIKDAETASEVLAERINEMMAATAIVRKTILELNVLVPLSMTENAIRRRLATRLGEWLSQIFPGRYEIGDLRWRTGRLRSWLDADKASTDFDVKQITGVLPNGRDHHSDET